MRSRNHDSKPSKYWYNIPSNGNHHLRVERIPLSTTLSQIKRFKLRSRPSEVAHKAHKNGIAFLSKWSRDWDTSFAGPQQAAIFFLRSTFQLLRIATELNNFLENLDGNISPSTLGTANCMINTTRCPFFDKTIAFLDEVTGGGISDL